MQRLRKHSSVISTKTLIPSIQRTLGDGCIAIAAGFSFREGVRLLVEALCLLLCSVPLLPGFEQEHK